MIRCVIPSLNALILSIGAISVGYYFAAFQELSGLDSFLNLENDGFTERLRIFGLVLPLIAFIICIVLINYILKFQVRICIFIISSICAIFWGLLLTTNEKQIVWKLICLNFISNGEIILLFFIINYIHYKEVYQ